MEQSSPPIDALREGARIIADVFKALETYLRMGISEASIASQIRRKVNEFGGQGLSFPTLVASGPRSAEPHARPSGRKLQKGDLVFIDFGVKINGFCSDATRSYVVGKSTQRQRNIHQWVLDAQHAAIAVARTGVPVSAVDLAARNLIRSHRHGCHFPHSTGHGVGRKVHTSPRIHFKSKEVLFQGDVVTIEPAIYIPGWGGIRIEDMICISDHTPEILTNYRRDLIEV